LFIGSFYFIPFLVDLLTLIIPFTQNLSQSVILNLHSNILRSDTEADAEGISNTAPEILSLFISKLPLATENGQSSVVLFAFGLPQWLAQTAGLPRRACGR